MFRGCSYPCNVVFLALYNIRELKYRAPVCGGYIRYLNLHNMNTEVKLEYKQLSQCRQLAIHSALLCYHNNIPMQISNPCMHEYNYVEPPSSPLKSMHAFI